MDKSCIEILRKDKTLLHSYALKPGDKLQDGLRLALEDACQKQISLSGADLSHKRIVGAVLNGLDLSHADLSGSLFSACQANNANLSSIKGKGLLISRSELNGANLSSADLSHGTIHKSHLKGAEIGGAKFNGALINNTNMDGVKTFQQSNVSFDGAMLFKCSLKSAILDNAYLRFSRIIKTDLDKAHFVLPKFHKSLIDDCSVNGFNLDGAFGSHIKIKRTDIKDIQISGADNLQSVEVDNFVYGESKNLTKIVNDNWVSIPHIDSSAAKLEMLEAIKAKNQFEINRLCVDIPRPGKQFDMSDSDLSSLDLTGLQLKGIDFTGSDFSNSTLTDASLSKSTIDGCLFNSSTGKQLNCAGVIMDGVSARNTRFIHLNMQYSNSKEAVLCFAYIKDVAMVNSEMNGTKILCSYLDKKSLFNDSLLIGANFKSVELRGGSFSGANLSESNLTSVHAAHTRFAKAIMEHSFVKNSDFDRTDFSSVNLSASTLNAVSIRRAKMQRLEALGATMHSVSIEESALQGSNFTRASMKLGCIKDCNVSGSNWDKSMVDTVAISNTNVSDTRNTPTEMMECAGIKQDKPDKTHKPEPMPNELKELLQGFRPKEVFQSPSII